MAAWRESPASPPQPVRFWPLALVAAVLVPWLVLAGVAYLGYLIAGAL